MNCSILKATKENILQVTDSRIKSLVYAYAIIGWKSRKQNEIFFSIKGIAFYLKVWYNTDKGKRAGRKTRVHLRRGCSPPFCFGWSVNDERTKYIR